MYISGWHLFDTYMDKLQQRWQGQYENRIKHKQPK